MLSGATMSLLSNSSSPRLLRALAAGVLLLGVGYGLELLSRYAFSQLRVVGVLFGLVGLGVFFVAGVFYLGRYLAHALSDLFG